MVWQELSPYTLYELKNPLVIDVRSPCEHIKEKIPESYNMPLLSDSQREEVGIIYKQAGEITARQHALKLIVPKIPQIIDELMALRQHRQPIVVYCWRGGLRSESVASLLHIAGISCFRLTGGYKAWRKMVFSDLQDDRYSFDPIVLYGLAGVGKTEILGILEKLGAQILDIEKLANHRGSVFGSMGKGSQPSQKDFDGILWQKLKNLESRPVFLEAESRKVGQLALPNCLLTKIQKGTAVLITTSLEKRIQRISADYIDNRQTHSTLAGLILLKQLKEHVGSSAYIKIEKLVKSGMIEGAIEILLTQYYDVLYNHAIKQKEIFQLELCGDNPDQAASELIQWASS